VASTILSGIDLQRAFLANACGPPVALLALSFARSCVVHSPEARDGRRAEAGSNRRDQTFACVRRCLALGEAAFSGNGDPVLRAALGALDIMHHPIYGLETSVSIHQTVIDAPGSGAEVTVLSAVGLRCRPDATRVCLVAPVRVGANVPPAASLFYTLLEETSHSFLKAYTQLVKNHV
jgi:hypothetical protein